MGSLTILSRPFKDRAFLRMHVPEAPRVWPALPLCTWYTYTCVSITDGAKMTVKDTGQTQKSLRVETVDRNEYCLRVENVVANEHSLRVESFDGRSKTRYYDSRLMYVPAAMTWLKMSFDRTSRHDIVCPSIASTMQWTLV